MNIAPVRAEVHSVADVADAVEQMRGALRIEDEAVRRVRLLDLARDLEFLLRVEADERAQLLMDLDPWSA